MQSPDFDIYQKGKSRPKQIESLMEAAEAYYYNPFRIPTLANLNGRRNHDGYPRQNRSDAREAEVRVMKAILSCLEGASLRTGTPLDNGDFINRSCGELAEIANLQADLTDEEIKHQIPMRPSIRFWRAFRRVQKAGMVQTYMVRLREKVIRDGKVEYEWRSRPAIKVVNPHFLVAMGTLDYSRLKKFRDFCSSQLKSRRDLYDKQFGSKKDSEKAERRLRKIQKSKGIKTHDPKRPKRSSEEALKQEKLSKRYHAEKVRMQATLITKGIISPKAILDKILAVLGTEKEYILNHS